MDSAINIVEVFAKSWDKMLDDFKSKTITRKNKNGTDDILLHRGMHDEEHSAYVKDNQCHHHTCKEKKEYEWSTNKKDADDFAEQCVKAKKKGHSISAWIPEQDIKSIKPNILKKDMSPAVPSPIGSGGIGMSSNPYNDVSAPMSDGGSLTQTHAPAFQSQTSAFVAPSMPAEINSGMPTLTVTKSYGIGVMEVFNKSMDDPETKSNQLKSEWRAELKERGGSTEKSEMLRKQLYDHNKKHFAIHVSKEPIMDIRGNPTGKYYGQIDHSKVSSWADSEIFHKIENGKHTPNETGVKVGIKSSRGGGSAFQNFDHTPENAKIVHDKLKEHGYNVEMHEGARDLFAKSYSPTVDDIIVPTPTEHSWASYQAELWTREFTKSQLDMFKSQLDMFGGEAPQVPKIPADPSSDRINNLSTEHKQIYNTLTKKQKSNNISSPERTHLTRFNQYIKGDISHEQLKNYIAYKQNEHHTPLFQNSPEVPKVEAPAPESQPTDDEQGKVIYRGQQINQVKRNPNQAGTWYAEDKKLAQHFADHVVGKGKPNGEVIEHNIDGKIFHLPHHTSDYAGISDKLGEIFGTSQQKIREALGDNHKDSKMIRIHSLLENKGIHKILKDQGYGYVKAKEKLNSKGDSTPTYLKLDDEQQPTVGKVESPATDKAQFPSAEPKIDPVEAPKKKFNYEVLKETEKAMHLKIPSWEATHDGKKSHKQLYHELWIPKSVLARGDDYAKDFAFQAKEKIRTSNPYQRKFGKPNPELRATLGEYAPIKEKKTRIVPDKEKAQKMLEEMKHRYNGESLERLSIDGGLSDEDYKLFNALRFTTDYDGKFKNDPLHPMKTHTYYESPLKKSQMDMFEGEPKVDPIEAPKVAEVKTSENFIKPEHELTSDNGTWKIKGDPTATAKMHRYLKDKYNKKEIYTYGGLLRSGHSLADKIKELHGDDNEKIFDHYNKITGRESGKPAGVGETQLRMSMKDDGGLPIGDKHFQVPDLSKKAKIERDSYSNGEALHEALNNRDTSKELFDWHKNYKFNSHHTNKATISEDNPEGKKYERSLFDFGRDNFGKIKQSNDTNLNPEDLEKYNSLKEKYEGSEFNEDHKNRLKELKKKARKTYHISDKFDPQDKERYDAIQADKERFTKALQDKTLVGKQRDAHQEVLDDLVSQESDMLNDYRERLGLHKGDETGEKGFSYKEDLPETEKTELEDLKAKKEYSRLNNVYNQPPEEHHISKLLKYPMSSNQKNFDEEIADDPKEEANLFDGKQETPKAVEQSTKPTPKVEPIIDNKKAVKVKPVNIEDHFPTVGIESERSLQKTAKEYGHKPEDSTKEYKPESMVDFNGSKYQIQSDGGSYVLAKNMGTGKSETLLKGDIENYPTDKKMPVINKPAVEQFMQQHGEEGMPLEDIYSKMGFSDDLKGKEYIKKRLRMALLQLEHHHETGGYHEPKVNREAGAVHPKEKDPKEQGIIYKLAKSLIGLATQTRLYIKAETLIKSLMIELYPKEKSIYEKSIANKDIFESLVEWYDRQEMLSGWLDNIQETTIMKSGTRLLDLSCSGVNESTNDLSVIQSRFELLKSMDNGSFQKYIDTVVALDEEEANNAKWKLSKSYKNNNEDSRDN